MDELTPAQVQELQYALHKAARHGKVIVLGPPLPRRVRLRLWATRHINGAAIWLVDHGHTGAAVNLWRVSGLWAISGWWRG